ncbi:hypothetical protein [Vibrio diabolicus]|uniref:hypothetical protein n=1 Tax=Vibrio diabolicus TaxID=50719 RepID=UPI00211B0E09|nr:hypothetical protein [Vibrio diabolicus]MCG9621395.1 hypothetical protein [Vibrio diabolicus]
MKNRLLSPVLILVSIYSAGSAANEGKNIIEPESLNQANDFPERKGNETLDEIGNALFTLGQMGLAENLQEGPITQTGRD